MTSGQITPAMVGYAGVTTGDAIQPRILHRKITTPALAEAVAYTGSALGAGFAYSHFPQTTLLNCLFPTLGRQTIEVCFAGDSTLFANNDASITEYDVVGWPNIDCSDHLIPLGQLLAKGALTFGTTTTVDYNPLLATIEKGTTFRTVDTITATTDNCHADIADSAGNRLCTMNMDVRGLAWIYVFIPDPGFTTPTRVDVALRRI